MLMLLLWWWWNKFVHLWVWHPVMLDGRNIIHPSIPVNEARYCSHRLCYGIESEYCRIDGHPAIVQRVYHDYDEETKVVSFSESSCNIVSILRNTFSVHSVQHIPEPERNFDQRNCTSTRVLFQ